MELPFREEEVFIALNEMDEDKASGLDSFTLAFWHDSWHFVKEEIMEMFREFFVNGTFTKSLNTTFLVLISLLDSLYKLLAKVLANLLKRVAGKVVSRAQCLCGGVVDFEFFFNCKRKYKFLVKEKGERGCFAC